jgi:hypothetical protein
MKRTGRPVMWCRGGPASKKTWDGLEGVNEPRPNDTLRNTQGRAHLPGGISTGISFCTPRKRAGAPLDPDPMLVRYFPGSWLLSLPVKDQLISSWLVLSDVQAMGILYILPEPLIELIL